MWRFNKYSVVVGAWRSEETKYLLGAANTVAGRLVHRRLD
jgi:hypothetical protein